MTSRPTVATVTGRFIGGGLFQPRADKNDATKVRYSACVVLDDGEHQKVDRAIAQATADRWGAKPPAGFLIWGVRKGDDPAYETSYNSRFINPKSTRPPQTLVRRADAYAPTAQEDGVIYPGCYVAVSVEAYGYEGDKKRGVKPGVSLNLRAVLFRRDGERLDDYVDAEETFGGVEVARSDDGVSAGHTAASAGGDFFNDEIPF